MKNIRLHTLVGVLGGLALGLSGQVTAQQKALEYNSIVQITSVQHNKKLWTHPASRVVKDASNNVLYGIENDPVKAAYEILGGSPDGGDNRQNSSCSFMSIRAKDAPDKIGPVNYGDEVEIWSLSTFEGMGWGSHCKVLLDVCKWWVHLGSRFTFGNPSVASWHYEILVSPSSEPKTKNGQQLFALVNADNASKTGPVMQNDVVYIVSKSSNESRDKKVWLHTSSRWGGPFFELIVNDGNPQTGDRALSMGKFKIQAVDRASIVDARPGLPKDTAREVYDLLKNPPKDVAPGGKSHTHLPQVAGESLRAQESWKLGEPGKGWIKFKARAKNDIFVAFSTLSQDFWVNGPGVVGGAYDITIGGWNNTQSTIRRGVGGAWTLVNNSRELVLSNIKQGGNPNAVVTGGLPKDGSTWDDYWAQVDNGVVTWGKGAVVGQNEMQRYVDPAPLKFVQYVLLGGYSTARVEFKDIEFSKLVPVPLAINLPEKFEVEEGKAKRVTVGSRNGELEVWVVGFDNLLYRYDTYSMAPSPWVVQSFKDAAGAFMKFEDVSCASDGTLVALSSQGKALKYDWDKKAWSPIDPGKGNETLDFEFISAGNKDCIWAVDTDDKDIYELTKEGWKVRADGIGVYVAAGVDGTVIALNEKGEPYRYRDGKWFEMAGVKLERIAVGDRHHIIGSTDKDNALWQWTRGEWKKHAEGKPADGKIADGKHDKSAHKKGAGHKDGEHKYDGPRGKWEAMLGKDGKPATGFDEVAINAAGTVFAADEDGDIYHRGEAGVALTKPTPEAVKAEIAKVVAAGKPAPKPEVVEKQLSVAKVATPKKAETRSKAKKTGKVKVKPAKKKTSGKGKALKRGAKVKKKAKNLSKIVKKAQKKIDKKKKVAKKAAKKPAKKHAKKAAKKASKK